MPILRGSRRAIAPTRRHLELYPFAADLVRDRLDLAAGMGADDDGPAVPREGTGDPRADPAAPLVTSALMRRSVLRALRLGDREQVAADGKLEHTAQLLLSARLVDAAAAGCDITVVTTQPGSRS